MKEIYVLVGMDGVYLQCLRKIKRIESEIEKIYRADNRKRMEELGKEKSEYLIPQYWMGPKTIAYFETQDDAVKFLEENGDQASEERYTMMIIEKHPVGSWDYLHHVEEPLFYEYYYKGSTGESGFREIQRPEYLIGSCNFAS